MVEDYIFQPSALGDEEIGIEKSLRPARLEEFIGQRPVVENLRIAIDSAKARGDVLDHVLFSGLPGLGKTTLSYLIASTMDVDIYCASGPSLERGKDVLGLLTGLSRGDVLFIDELHRMSKEAEEYLYSAMEDFKVDLIVDRGADARTIPISVAPFTLVGATTREGNLSPPFRSRFGIIEKLELYPPSDIAEVISRSAGILQCTIEDEACQLLSTRCRGTPRYANRFLRRIRDVAQYRSGLPAGASRPAGRGQAAGRGAKGAAGRGVERAVRQADPTLLSLEYVREGLERLGIDQHGLDRMDRKILDILMDSDEPVGVKTICATVGEEERTIEDVHEPFLIQQGMLLKTPRGRRASPKAYQLYGRRQFTQRELFS